MKPCVATSCTTPFGCLVLVVSGVQLCTPHHPIATASEVVAISRAVAAAVFIAIFAAAFSSWLNVDFPKDISAAVLKASLPTITLPAFVEAMLNNDTAALTTAARITPKIIALSVAAMKKVLRTH